MSLDDNIRLPALLHKKPEQTQKELNSGNKKIVQSTKSNC